MKTNTNHSHTGHRQRLKEKVLQAGIEYWPSHEIMELILTYTIPYKDVNPLAHELIDTFGSFSGVLDAGYQQLVKIKGVGHETALFLSLLPDLFDKYNASRNMDGIVLDTTLKCVNYFRSINRTSETEALHIFCLNSKKKLVKTIKIENKLESMIRVNLSEFVNQIASKKHKYITLIHNHPNGNCSPSSQDIETTEKLVKTSEAVGIVVDDHIIVADKGYYSFKADGMV